MICFYHCDADGRCAGAVVRKYIQEHFPNTEQKYVEVDYARQDGILSQITEGETVYVVDFHFSPELMREVSKVAGKVRVFDHHKTGAAATAQYPKEVECYCDPGSSLAGCELVWNCLFPITEMPGAVTLIADRDKWAWKHGEMTAQFNEGLKLYSHQPMDKIWDCLLGVDSYSSMREADTSKIMEQGKVCLQYRDNMCEEFRKSWGFEAEMEAPCRNCGGEGRTSCNEPAERDTCIKCGGTGKKSYKCYVMNLILPGIGSEMFAKKLQEYDICIGIVYKNGLWKLSLRSNGKVDVSEIAKKLGGGGHAMAAGVEGLKELPFKILEQRK